MDILIFLDVDGVLNTTNSRNTKFEILDKNVAVLGKLNDALAGKGYLCKIILTSTWRLGYDADYDKCSEQVQRLRRKLETVGIKIEGKIPVYKEKTRDVEILRYIREYQLKNTEFSHIVLDDDVSIFDKDRVQKLNLYKVNQHTGLIEKDVKEIIKRLSRV